MNGSKISHNFEGLKIFDDKKSTFHYMNQIENGCFFIDLLSNNSFEQKIRKIAKKQRSYYQT